MALSQASMEAEQACMVEEQQVRMLWDCSGEDVWVLHGSTWFYMVLGTFGSTACAACTITTTFGPVANTFFRVRRMMKVATCNPLFNAVGQ